MENIIAPFSFSLQQMSALSFKDALKYLLDLEYYLDKKVEELNNIWTVNHEEHNERNELKLRCDATLKHYVDVVGTHPTQTLSIEDLKHFTQIALDMNVKSIQPKLLFNAFQRALPQLAGNLEYQPVLRELAAVYQNPKLLNFLGSILPKNLFTGFLNYFDDITFLDFVVQPIFNMDADKVQEFVDYAEIKRNAEQFNLAAFDNSFVLYLLKRWAKFAKTEHGKTLSKTYHIIMQSLCHDEFQMLNQLNEKYRDNLDYFLNSVRMVADNATQQPTELFTFKTIPSALFDVNYSDVMAWFSALGETEDERLDFIVKKRLNPCFEETHSFFNVVDNLDLILERYPQLEATANNKMATFVVTLLKENRLKHNDIPSLYSFSHSYFKDLSRAKNLMDVISHYYHGILNPLGEDESNEVVFAFLQRNNLLDVFDMIEFLDRSTVKLNLNPSCELQMLSGFHNRHANYCRKMAQELVIEQFNSMPKVDNTQSSLERIQTIKNTILQAVDVDFSKFQWQQKM